MLFVRYEGSGRFLFPYVGGGFVKAPSVTMTTETPSEEERAFQPSCPSPRSTPSTQRAMTPNSPCEHIIEFTDQSETRRRFRFVPCEGEEWQRIEEVWQHADWQLVGQDTVSNVDQWTRPI